MGDLNIMIELIFFFFLLVSNGLQGKARGEKKTMLYKLCFFSSFPFFHLFGEFLLLIFISISWFSFGSCRLKIHIENAYYEAPVAIMLFPLVVDSCVKLLWHKNCSTCREFVP